MPFVAATCISAARAMNRLSPLTMK